MSHLSTRMTLKPANPLEAKPSPVLKPGQAAALARIAEFLKSDRRAFIPKGYAGTGKTFLVARIAALLRSAGRPCVLLAPTGRAARVLGDRVGAQASTLHRHIFAFDKLIPYKAGTADTDAASGGERGTYRFYYGLKPSAGPSSAVFIVDESSMVSDHSSDGEFIRFGSGNLLSDFIAFLNLDANDHHRQVIFVGDPAQLTPVAAVKNEPAAEPHDADGFSPALDAGYLTRKFGLAVDSAELTEIVRQGEGSGILAVASRLREGIARRSGDKVEIRADGKDLPEVVPGWKIEAFMALESPERPSVVITHSNAQALEWNRSIRDRLGFAGADPRPGDRLLVVANSYSSSRCVHNGDIGLVTARTAAVVERKVKLDTMTKKGVYEPVEVTLRFADLRISFPDESGRPVEDVFTVFLNLLDSPNPQADSDQSRALYVDFKKRHDGRGGRPKLKEGTPEFAMALRNDKFYSALRVKYGYAVTCHKAQGGGWGEPLIDLAYAGKRGTTAWLRWIYTALTRARVRAHLVHLSAAAPRALVSSLSADAEAMAGRRPPKFHVTEASLRREIDDSARRFASASRLEFAGIRDLPYLVQCHFRDGADSLRAFIHFNKRLVVTSARMEPSVGPLATRVSRWLASFSGRTGAAASGIHGEARHRLLGRLETACPETGVTLVAFDIHGDYQVTCRFAAGRREATVNVYFNGAGEMTRLMAARQTLSDPGLLVTVEGILAQGKADRR